MLGGLPDNSRTHGDGAAGHAGAHHVPVRALPLRVVFGVAAVLILMAALTYAGVEWSEVKEDESKRLTYVSELVAHSSEQTFDTHAANLRALARTVAAPALRGDYPEVERLFREFNANYPVLVSMNLIAPDSQLLATTLPYSQRSALPKITDAPGAMDTFTMSTEGGSPTRLRAIKSIMGKAWAIPLRHVIRDAADKPLFVISALVSIERMGENWNASAAPPGTVYLLMRPDGHRLLRFPAPADPDAFYSTRGSRGLPEVLSGKPEARQGRYATIRSDGSPVFGAYTRLARYDLAAAVSVPQSGLWTMWMQRILLPLSILTVMFAAAVVASVVAGRIQRRHIDARIATEARLREADARVNLAVDGSSLAIWEYDLMSRRLFLDRGWREHLGLALDGTYMTWEQFALLLRPSDMTDWNAKVVLMLNGTVDVFHEEARMRTLSGEWRWISIRGKVMTRDQQGRALLCAGVASDNTERRNARAAAEAARTIAEATSRAKSDFIDRLSHEVRTPVYGMLGVSELLIHGGLTADQSALVAGMRHSGNHLMQVVNDLLDFARLEAGQLRLEPVNVDVRALMEATLQPLHRQALEKGLAWHCRIAPEIPERIRTDPVRLAQVVSQLADNAIKFTEHGRIDFTLWLEARSANAATLCITVADSGIGIAPEMQGTIFDAFQQGNPSDSRATRKYGGPGLGLALCKAILHLMDGEINVTSKPGEGAVFEVTAKVGVAASVSDAPASQSAPGSVAMAILPGIRVLVVDDNAINRMVAATMLKKFKCEVDMAVNGVEAVAATAAKPYDLVLMDCDMPEMDGLTATMRIRERESASNAPRLPIIALTANVMPGNREACIEAGMDDFLGKPVTINDLKCVVSQWAPHHRGPA